ncbi:OB-fold domain-containing protein [Jatrophihabitans cynanchi]|uniref:OB-fold domain-containing protein n=1 Tax=Jatrophihabitans cynanchi TaxID=2944128 RepID=A0ABY7K0H4_9ACTN|nr:OB-fold domain-containing protein [Jatrophihabitans sp. SB3-54]WAX58361.1 OB-fold domain-containing protein [Jatrophihabitans sp. SB3-54]
MSAVAPVETPETAYIWAGYRAGQLRLQLCDGCGHPRFLPAYRCSACGSPDYTTISSAGAGHVYSFAVTRRPEELPLIHDFPVIVLVELDEGVRLISNLVDVAPADVQIGLRVQAYFDPVTAEATVVRFRPVSAS